MNTKVASRKGLDLARLNTTVPRDLYERARIEAVRRGTSIQQVLTELLEQIPEHVIVRKAVRDRAVRVAE